MNVDQLRTVLWLRWRLTVNQIKRHGRIWLVIVAIIFWMALLTSVCSFFGSISLGFYLARNLGPYEWMFVWDGIVLAFLSMWVIGLLIELQQSELLSLHKLLHLPIPLAGTFVCNYLTSLISVTAALFVPVMFGLSAALMFTHGWKMLVVPLLILTFLLLVSAVTYQFQGWLATMMLNPRRRRAVIATMSLVIILGSQFPNVINIFFLRAKRSSQSKQVDEAAFVQELNKRVARGEVKPEEFQSQLAAFRDQQTRRRKSDRAQIKDRVCTVGAALNAAVPVTWLAYGVKSAVEGTIWPGLLGCLGATLISVASLRRSYRTALKIYTGVIDSQDRSSAIRPGAAVVGKKVRAPSNLVERSWPWVSEQIAAVAWANLRSISRSPETRIMLAVPIIAPLVMVSLLFAHGAEAVPVVLRPLLALGGLAIPMLTLAQLLQNQFGVDRTGFRALVLTSAPRRDILLGKNLSLLPVVVAMSGLILAMMQLVLWLSVNEVSGLIVQTAAIYLLYCMTGNMLSIWFPAAVASGSLKPASANSRVIFAHLAFGLLFPIMWLPALAIYGVQVVTGVLLPLPYFPTFFLLSALQLIVTTFVYRRVLLWQGKKLQEREQVILQAVADRPE